MVLWSLLVDKVHRNPIDRHRLGRAAAAARRRSLDISLAKIAGLWGIWAIDRRRSIASAAGIGTGAYLFSMQVLGFGVVPMLVLSVPYVLWLDRRLIEPRDGAWHFGQLLIGRRRAASTASMLHDFFRAWAVKGFFLAFMISIVPGNWAETITRRLELDRRQPGQPRALADRASCS